MIYFVLLLIVALIAVLFGLFREIKMEANKRTKFKAAVSVNSYGMPAEAEDTVH